MHEKKYKWHKIADAFTELQFGENNIVQMEVGGKKVCIVKTLNGIAACAAKCPHAGGNMSEGFLDKNGNIVCPIHRYAFNFNNGRDVTGEGYYLKIYPVEIKDTGIFLGIEEGGLFNWLK
ncbi:MAG TPA: Rieske 2Fe-2S domain-containing protein [Ginsengibacter sp.]|nr:Rieske 2Fe-2S domain-containing protein [Ginsengibacter sp.]